MEAAIANATLKALRRILRATDGGNRKLAAASGLTPSQLLVLREVEARDEVTPGSIAQRLQFSHATITAIADRLVDLGLITRTRGERDKRQIHLTLLPDGSKALAGAPDPLQMRFIDRFDALPAWEQAMILAAAEKLAVLMDADTIDAAPLLDGGRIDRSEPH